MASHSVDRIRADIRSTIARLTTAAFGDADDVFELGVVRSLNLLELIVAIEDAHGFEVSQRDVFEGHLRSVERIVALVLARTARVA
jgi:methoxymalonate biosynthesis acyl carrier protein